MYYSPYIDDSGLHICSYDDILQDMIDRTKSIYGEDIYLENDSADYEFLSIFALKTYDCLLTLQLLYNNRSPATAIGAALDGLLKLNGLERKIPSYSTCSVTLSGTIGTIITNGVVQDLAGYNWSLPSIVTIPYPGLITVIAICQTLGAVTATAGSLTRIMTPTSGWASVTNSTSAIVGLPIEPDSLVRARQAISTKLPSLTLFDGTMARIAAVSGITRYKGYENYTNSVDSNGLDPHSIWIIAEGGTDEDIAQVIANNKSEGCGVNGTTTVSVFDDQFDTTVNIKFSRPTYITIYVETEVQLLSGGTSVNLTNIKMAIDTYLNSLQIGENLTISGLYGAAMSTMPNLLQPIFSIKSMKAGITESPLGTDDIIIAFDEVVQSVISPESTVVIEV